MLNVVENQYVGFYRTQTHMICNARTSMKISIHQHVHKETANVVKVLHA